MSGEGQLVFLVAGTVALVAALMTVALANPLRAAMALLVHIVSLGALYLTLHAHLLAAIQLLVYAGAVVVLFIFVIMLIGPSAELPNRTGEEGGGAARNSSLTFRALGAVLMVVAGAIIIFGVGSTVATYVDVPTCPEGVAECGQFGGVAALSQSVFVRGAVPFELLSILLLVAIVAAVAVAGGHTVSQKKALESRGRAKPEGEE